MKDPNSLSDNELKAYADEHLQYEHDMLIWSAGILARLFPYQVDSSIPWALVNGMLNTFAIHARNLIDFLYSGSDGKDRPTDIIIEDFVDAESISGHLPPISESLKKARVKVNKQVTHLTMERIEYEKAGKGWMLFEIADEIKKVMAAIAPQIPRTRISNDLRDKLIESRLAIPLVDISSIRAQNGAKVGVSLTLGKGSAKGQ